MKIGYLAAAAAALLYATSASAITYVGTLTAGNTTGTYSIETDGTLGILTRANIVSVSGTFTSATASTSFTNGNNVQVVGTATSATATQIFFDPTATGYFIFGNNATETTFTGACLTAASTGSCGGRDTSPAVLLAVNYPTDQEFRDAGTASYVVATAQDGAVPEPATWAMMIGGFGLVGASLRRRKVSVGFA